MPPVTNSNEPSTDRQYSTRALSTSKFHPFMKVLRGLYISTISAQPFRQTREKCCKERDKCYYNRCHGKTKKPEVLRAYNFKITRSCQYNPPGQGRERETSEEVRTKYWTGSSLGEPLIGSVILLLSCPSDNTSTSGHTPLSALWQQ